MPDSIFTRIIRGELPCHRVWEDADFFAFLDIHPIQRGHTLLIPKKEVDSIWDLDEQTYAALWQRARRLAVPISAAMNAVRTGIVVEGLAVPHVHVHLIPVNQTRDLDPAKHHPSTAADFVAVAESIRQAIARR
jgi:histidine triad (HIT) family protein